LAAATALILLCAACDGLLLGGEEAARIPLQPVAEGGYAPVRILLRPGMNPVSFSLHAGFAWGKHDEGGQWNSYRATLSADGRVIHSEDFQVNSPERGGQVQSASPPSSLQQRMMRVDLPAEAEYEFAIASLKPAVVTLDAPQLVVRVNVSRL
jgi:hypothetical protein